MMGDLSSAAAGASNKRPANKKQDVLSAFVNNKKNNNAMKKDESKLLLPDENLFDMDQEQSVAIDMDDSKTANDGKQASKKRRREVRSAADDKVLEDAIDTWFLSKRKNNDTWKFDSAVMRSEFVSDANKIAPKKKTIKQYIMDTYVSKTRKTFSNFTLVKHQEATVLKLLQEEQARLAKQQVVGVRDLIATCFGTEGPQQGKDALAIGWAHAEQLRLMASVANSSSSLGNSSKAPAVAAVKQEEQQDVEMEDADLDGKGGDGNRTPSGGEANKSGLLGGGPDEKKLLGGEDADPKTPARNDKSAGNNANLINKAASSLKQKNLLIASQASQDDEPFSPGTLALMQDTKDLIARGPGMETIGNDTGVPYDKVRDLFNDAEMGDWDAETGWIGIMRRWDNPAINHEHLECMVTMHRQAKAAGVKTEPYTTALPAAIVGLLTDRWDLGTHSRADYFELFGKYMKPASENTIDFWQTMKANCEDGKLRVPESKVVQVYNKCKMVEIPGLFAVEAADLKVKAEHMQRKTQIKLEAKPILDAWDSKTPLSAVELDKLNASLEGILIKVKASGKAGEWYKAFLSMLHDNGVKSAGPWLRDVCLHGADLPAMHQIFDGINVLDSVRAARVGLKKQIDRVFKPTDGLFKLYQVALALNKETPYLTYELDLLRMECDKLNDSQYVMLAAAEEEWVQPPGWILGGQWDEASKQMEEYITWAFAKRAEATELGKGKDETSALIRCYGENLAKKVSVTRKNVDAIVANFVTTVTALKKNKTAPLLEKAGKWYQKIKWGVAFFTEDHERKLQPAITALQLVEAEDAKATAKKTAYDRGIIKATKGKVAAMKRKA
ncbi:unnamed protein product [Amoebophrya sp. A120]|nr:unnamed protein product [Amoebophrya sp. A120]|eukprot:GSA120T00013405001.1